MASLFNQHSTPVSQFLQSSQNQQITLQLIKMYEERLKSLIQVSKIYSQTIQKDNQQGALAFMRTQEMKKYRIERELQLLKDTLLIEKQKIVIKVLTSYHQLKKDHQKLQTQNSTLQKENQKLKKQTQKINFSLTKNIPQKDNLTKTSQKQTKILQKPNASISRISLLSNHNEINSNTSISLYQKMLQQKMILVKQLQKKSKILKEETQQKSHKINLLEQKLKQTINQNASIKQCKSCPQYKENVQYLKDTNDKISKQNYQISNKFKQTETKLKLFEEYLHSKDIKITQIETDNQALKKQLETYKQKEPTHTSKPNKVSQQGNLQTIKELKQKLFLQEQQLMAITNSFEFLKQDLNQSLLNQVKRLRTSYQILQENIKTSISNIKAQMVTFTTQIIETVIMKCQNKKNHDEILRKLRKFDNQLDYFLEQKNINT